MGLQSKFKQALPFDVIQWGPLPFDASRRMRHDPALKSALEYLDLLVLPQMAHTPE